MQSLTKKEKKDLIKKCTPHSPVVKNTVKAFIVGGGICVIAELLRNLYMSLNVGEKDAQTLATLSIVAIGALLTAIGIFDRFARHAGAGTLVPITGFSNSVVSQAIDAVSEGYVIGLGSKIFTIAGPVILYAAVSGVIYGVIYYIIGFL